MAQESVILNGLKDNIRIINDDIKNINKYYKTGTFDIITCNPPYFKTSEDGYKNKNDYVTGYLVCKKNSRKDHFFKKYDYLNINILLYSDARIKRIRSNKIVIGYKILNKKEYETTKMLYDNLEFDNILEIDKYE